MLSLSTAEASLILWALVGCAAAQQLREKIDRLPVGGRRCISDAAASAGCSTDDFGCRCRRPDTVMLGGVAAGESCRVPHGGIPRTADPPGLRSPICEIGHGAAAAPVPTPRADAAAAGLSVAAATASALTAGAEAPAPTPPDPATTTFQTIRTSMPSPTRITPTAFGSILSALLAAGGPAGERAPSSMAALALAPYVSAPGAPPAASLLPTLAPPSMRPASPAEAPVGPGAHPDQASPDPLRRGRLLHRGGRRRPPRPGRRRARRGPATGRGAAAARRRTRLVAEIGRGDHHLPGSADGEERPGERARPGRKGSVISQARQPRAYRVGGCIYIWIYIHIQIYTDMHKYT
ncbi:hypothetical protein PZA11_003365 [Diplocarpon coronariae]